jgi:two-component system, OmpR family, sensor kinase
VRLIRTPRALRTRLLLAIVLGVGAGLAAGTVGFNVLVARSLSNDADEIVQARASGERATVMIDGGRIIAPALPQTSTIETRAWVFEGRTAIQSPPVTPELQRQAASLAGGPERSVDVTGDVRLYALPITADGRRVGTVVAGISLEPYQRTQVIALISSIALACAVLAAVALASAAILRAALRPVARMTEDAERWSEHDLDERFAVGPPHDEISRLAATLDGLLDRLAAGMRRERRLTAEVSHELRTPLAQIQAEADLALRRERAQEEYVRALEEIRGSAERIRATIETLLATARQEGRVPRGTGDVVEAATRVAGELGPLADGRPVVVRVDPTIDSVRAGVEPEVIERILHPVIENACRHGRGEVRVGVTSENGDVTVTVADDGPGVPEPDRERIFEPGVRVGDGEGDGDAAVPGGAGLGLPLARRLARAAGGDVHAEPGLGGRFTIRLPSA